MMDRQCPWKVLSKVGEEEERKKWSVRRWKGKKKRFIVPVISVSFLRSLWRFQSLSLSFFILPSPFFYLLKYSKSFFFKGKIIAVVVVAVVLHDDGLI